MDFKILKDGSNQLPEEMRGQQPKEEPKLDVAAIPDLEKLLDRVLEFLRYINKTEMQELENEDKFAFERHLDSKFEDLSLRYYSIFRLLLDKDNREDNVCKLIDIFSTLKKVKTGSLDIHKATEEYHEELNSEYIYPKFGGKEQFEKKMQKEKNKKRK